MPLTATDRAYLAGIIDGEGCVSVSWRNKKYLTPTVQVSNTNKVLLGWLQARYGGSVYVRKDSRPTRKQGWVWSVAGQKALTVLRDARPYLLLKTEQADILLKLPRQHSIERDVLGRIKGKMGPEELAANQEVKGKIAYLNKRGPRDAA